jgi:hypothetical protein
LTGTFWSNSAVSEWCPKAGAVSAMSAMTAGTFRFIAHLIRAAPAYVPQDRHKTQDSEQLS